MPPLAGKLKLKAGHRGALINAPDGYRKELGKIPAGVTLETTLRGKFDWVQVFAKNGAELRRFAPRAIRALAADGFLWISFPKGTSPVQTDLTRDRGWETVRKASLKWVVLVSVNEDWSAFGVRPFRTGEERRSFR